jgi:hypothetical protein
MSNNDMVKEKGMRFLDRIRGLLKPEKQEDGNATYRRGNT